MARSPMRGRSRIAQFIAGMCSVIVVLVVVAGIPLTLARLGTGLLPHHVPSLADVKDALLHKDVSGTLFIQALVIVGWLAWATFALSIVVELVARIRGRNTLRLPGMRAQQRWAAALIAAIALMFVSPAIASATAVPRSTPVVSATAAPAVIQTVSVTPAAAASIPAASVPAASVPAASVPLTYHVKHGDYLGSIAERFEGDFNDYHSLAQANHIQDPSHIEPGWTIKLPPNAVDHGTLTHATGAAVTSHPVDPTTPPSTTQTPPATTPVSPAPAPTPTAAAPMPTTTAPKPTIAAPTTAAPKPTTAAPTTAAPTPTGAAPTSAAPKPTAHVSTKPASSGAGHVGKVIPRPAHSPAAGVATHQNDASGSHGTVVEMLEASGTLAAVVALSLLAVSRREQLQRRFVKHVAAPPSGGDLPRLMTPTQQRDVIRVDSALRSLATLVDGWPIERIPQIAGVWMDHHAVTLMLADDCGKAPKPFIDDANGWSLASDAVLEAQPAQLAPLPTLVTVGGRANQHLLLDLEYLRLVGIGGEPAEAMNLLRFIAVELTHNVWSDDVRVVLSGFGDQAAALAAIDMERVRVQPSIDEAIVRFRRRLARAVANWDAPPGPPEVLLIAEPPDEVCDDIVALERDLMRAPGVGMAVVVGATPASFAADHYQVRVSKDGLITVGFLGDAVMPAASLPTMLLPEVASLIDSARAAGDTSPLDLARAASRAAVRNAAEVNGTSSSSKSSGWGNGGSASGGSAGGSGSSGGGTAGRTATGRAAAQMRRTGTMAGQHRRPPGQKPEARDALVDLMKARHARTA